MNRIVGIIVLIAVVIMVVASAIGVSNYINSQKTIDPENIEAAPGTLPLAINYATDGPGNRVDMYIVGTTCKEDTFNKTEVYDATTNTKIGLMKDFSTVKTMVCWAGQWGNRNGAFYRFMGDRIHFQNQFDKKIKLIVPVQTSFSNIIDFTKPTLTPTPKQCSNNTNCSAEEICNSQKVCEPIVCATVAPNECQTNQKTPHTCDYIAKSNGTACTSGTCQNGACIKTITSTVTITTSKVEKASYNLGEKVKIIASGTATGNTPITVTIARHKPTPLAKTEMSAKVTPVNGKWSGTFEYTPNTLGSHEIVLMMTVGSTTSSGSKLPFTVAAAKSPTNCQNDHTVCSANQRCVNNACTSDTTLACTQIPTGKTANCLNITISNRICNYTTSRPNGTACGTNMICTNGQCTNNAGTGSYSNVRALGINIVLEDRAFPATYKYPNTFVGIWREDGTNSKLLTYKIVDLTAGKTYDDAQFFSTNGSSYTLGENDYLIVKPESYLSKIYQLKTLSLTNNKLQLNDTEDYFAGDTRIDTNGRFDRVTVSDYNYFKESNAYGNSDKYDYYYLNYYVNSSDSNTKDDYQINIQDIVKFRNNMGKTGGSETLNAKVVPAIQEILNGKLYRVVEIN